MNLPGTTGIRGAPPRIRRGAWWYCLVLASALAGLPGCGDSPAPASKEPVHSGGAKEGSGLFVEVTKEAGIDFVHQLADGKMDNIMESDGAGGALLDYDNDGLVDIYLVNSGPAPVLSDAPAGTSRAPNRLYHNLGGMKFEDATAKAGVGGHGFGTTAAAADYDNDGFTDLLVVNFGGLILYHNEGNGTFKDVTEKAGMISKGPGISATFLDADGDGYLDLFVGNYLKFDPAIKPPAGSQAPYPGPTAYEPEFNILYRNKGDGTFEDVSQSTGIRIAGHRAMSVTALDYDLDGDQDLYISNDGTPNLLLANDGKGHFKDVAPQSGVAFNQFGDAGGSMGAAVGDSNGDGLPDLFVTRFGVASLYVNSKGGFFEDRLQRAGIFQVSSQFTGWGGSFIDVDNDGDLDLIIVNGHAHFLKGMPTLFFENRGDGTFADASAKAGPFFQKLLNSRGLMAGDLDNDGRVDMVITTLGGAAALLRNVAPGQSHWLTLKLKGSQSNRDGFGAQVRVTAGGRTQYAENRCPTSYVSQQDSRLHFGLGASASADRIEIRWPSGQTQVVTNLAAGKVHLITEPGESRWR